MTRLHEVFMKSGKRLTFGPVRQGQDTKKIGGAQNKHIDDGLSPSASVSIFPFKATCSALTPPERLDLMTCWESDRDTWRRREEGDGV